MDTTFETSFTPATSLEVIASLRSALSQVMRVDNHTIHEPPVDLLEFTGKLTCSSDEAFRHIYKSFIAYGYTPMLTERDGKEIVVAKHGIVEATRSDTRINALLLIATIASTVLAGVILYANTSPLAERLLSRVNDPLEAIWIVLRTPALWAIGVPYALTLLTILGVHEMGHYVMARRHKADVTLPYFIPMPFGLGTMGALIRLKSPIKNRRQLFDIGVAGPLAGLAVAIPLLIIGLSLSPVEFVGRPVPGAQEGNSILYAVLKFLTKGQWLPGGGFDVMINAIAFPAWFGLIITMINLLPIGQLDGGHIIYSMFGRVQWKVAVVAEIILLGLGVYLAVTTGQFFNVWLLWAILVQVFGLRHPPPLDDLTPLDRKRKLIGWVTIAIFFLIFTPLPFS
ncbi:MAG: site-2 protease family protein [Chloroflexi bacterium]|nr:site-2 protease family protein [Chloroflexota bacterium]